MNLKEMLDVLTRDRSYDDRKVLNGVDLIKTANQLGLNYDQIAELCGVSKTTISHWGNKDKKQLPRRSQVEKLLSRIGYGRFECDLEPLSDDAIEYRRGVSTIAACIFLLTILGFVWYVAWKPCSDSWEECSALPWYERPLFTSYKAKQNIEDFRQYMKQKEHGVAE
ncbi:helix-turn-helix transcriptional regulator [Motiliproteus sp. MSK22-1]|uniref:helix-turn-helix domain-containing protein n=1 Tax=Motiliproteus sp. MSK22-1 TaxID=1897630 RepID=UPI0009772038|nr:helix-turn-helix transcriptional regulator [Motiliproteus sp. MSK22-1]OMH39452.1 hypothetical protein BGP75_02330 [Motiliproteus sp. MSK22-1]